MVPPPFHEFDDRHHATPPGLANVAGQDMRAGTDFADHLVVATAQEGFESPHSLSLSILPHRHRTPDASAM